MAILSGQVIFEGDSINFLSSGDIYGRGLFYGLSRNQNSITSGFFYGQSMNNGTVLQATFTQNSINSGYVLYDAVFTDTSTNKGTISGNALFARTAINDGVVLGDIAYSRADYNQIGNSIFTGTQFSDSEVLRGTGIMESGTGIFYNFSENCTNIINGIFFDDSKNSWIVDDAIFYDNSCNDVRASHASFFDHSVNYRCVYTGLFHGNSVNHAQAEVGCYAIFLNNSINSGCVMGDALFLDNSSNKCLVMGNARFESTATNDYVIMGVCSLYIPNAREWTQTSSFIPLLKTDSRSNSNRIAINQNGDKIIVKATSGSFKAYSIGEPVNGLKPSSQLGSDILSSGYSVSMNADGNRIAIGDRSDVINGVVNVGSVAVYDWNGLDWQQFNEKITFGANVDFAKSISLNSSGDRIAIGIPGHNSANGTDNGTVYITCWNGQYSEWDGVGYSTIHGEDGEKIGQSVKLNASGDRVVFSYPSGFKAYCAQNILRPDSDPAVYDICWYQMGSDISLPNANQYQLLHPSYSLNQVSMNADGDKILVSQIRLMQDSCLSGVVGAYLWSGNSWNQMGDILHSEYQEDYFGWDVKMNSLGDKIIISASNSLAGTQDYARGKALIYDWSGSNWNKVNYDLGKHNINIYNTNYGQQVLIAASGNTVYASKDISGLTFVSQYQIL